jgi:4'-phosphopantetheinyl transferase EntD
MSKIEELKTDIERLSSEEASELFRWLSEREWESWDKEMEADSQAGRLDFLVKESLHEHPHHPVTRDETRTPTPAGP